MFNKQNFCHIASNNRNDVKAGVFVYKTTDDLATVSTSGYFNDKIVDINLHDLIIHEWHDPADKTKVQKNVLCVTERTLDNVGTSLIKSDWQEDIEQEIIDLANIYLKLDGTNIMTGPLKMRSSISFKCAIAPSWDGVGFYKLNDDDSLTLMASMESTDGLTPAQNNTYNIGKASYKWKDAYIGRVITSVINNGFDIAVPVTNQAETLALKSEVDLAANSGRMITDEGVWYAKMAAAGTIPAEAAVEGRNYADFTQVDGSGNPIIVIYTYTSGSWTQTETITPPAEYDGYVPVTSKIWDIAEQTGQQGGRILWNHQSKEFTPYPMIISFENIDVTGESTVAMPVSSVPGQIVNKQYVDNLLGSAFANRDLSNLTSTGANIGNWSHNVSNCVAEIPQDIKLELSSGTLTLKAGSKVYVPNGEGVFDVSTTTADISRTTFSTQSGTDILIECVLSNGVPVGVSWSSPERTSSGTMPPTDGIFYNMSTNYINNYSGGAVQDQRTFPIASVTMNNGTVTSIDQVFNGFGYIGSTVFALPGVKVIAPNGRNTDGTLHNATFVLGAVKTAWATTPGQKCVFLNASDLRMTTSNTYRYDETTNHIYRGPFTEYGTVIDTNVIVDSNSKITKFNPKTAFHAVDYSDFAPVDNFVRTAVMGVPDYSAATQITSPWTATDNGYVCGGRYASDNMSASITINGITVFSVSTPHSGSAYGNAPVAKGDSVTLGAGTYYFVPCKKI